MDEIKYFKECIEYLHKEETNLYSNLVAVLPSDELMILEQKMNKAISTLE